MKAVILAGGFGKRLGNVSLNTPKPMTIVCDKPVLEYQINALRKEGIKEFVFVVGYLYEQIEAYFGNGEKFGVEITYYKEKAPLGTGGALFDLGLNEDFLLCNGDLIFDFCLEEMLDFHRKNKALATLLTHPNSHPYDSTLLSVSGDGCVEKIIPKNEKPYAYSNLCNAGIQIVSPEILGLCKASGKVDFDGDIIKPAIKTGRVYSYKTAEYVKDMGTPERLETVERDIKTGVVEKRHKRHLQKAIFLDRDGTINVHKGYIKSSEEIELITGVSQAISRLNSIGYLVIVVTNQPVVARGECTLGKLKEINNRIETLLGEKGAYIDEFYCCPHHPDSGFENEIKELKIKCDCRKPSPGLLLQAKKDFNIDMANSFMVGDSLRDVEAGINAGCKSVYLSETDEGSQSNTIICKSLADFSELLSNRKLNI